KGVRAAARGSPAGKGRRCSRARRRRSRPARVHGSRRDRSRRSPADGRRARAGRPLRGDPRSRPPTRCRRRSRRGRPSGDPDARAPLKGAAGRSASGSRLSPAWAGTITPVTAADTQPDLLGTPEAGGRVVRGGLLRGLGYAVGTLVAAGTSVLLLRHLGRDDFGRYGTVGALLGVISGISDAGLTAVGARELALAPPADRPRMLRNLVTLRLAITPVGIIVALVFAVLAYDRTMVWGTLLGGIGVLFVNTQATMMMPLTVDLRLGTVTIFEVLKTTLTFVFVAGFVAAGWSLLPLLAIQIPVGVALILLTPLAVPVGRGLVPGYDRALARTLIREALPLAIALTMNVVYFRVLMQMMYLIGTKAATGLFATSFQVFSVLFTLPLLVLSSALPVLSVAGRD